MGKCNTVVSAYTTYRHLQQYCSLPSNYKYGSNKIHLIGQLTEALSGDWSLGMQKSDQLPHGRLPVTPCSLILYGTVQLSGAFQKIKSFLKLPSFYTYY